MPAHMTNYPKPGSVVFKPADQKTIAPIIATDDSEKTNVTHVVDSRSQCTLEANLEQVTNVSFNRYIYLFNTKANLKQKSLLHLKAM